MLAGWLQDAHAQQSVRFCKRHLRSLEIHDFVVSTACYGEYDLDINSMPTPSNHDVKITLLDRDPAVPLEMMASSNVTRFFLAHNLRFEVDGMVSDFAQHRERFVSDDTSQLVRVSAQNAGIAPLMALTCPAASYDWAIGDLAPSPPPGWSREQYLQAHTAARGRLRRHGQLVKDYVIVIVAIDGTGHPLAFPRPDSSCWWLDDLEDFDIVIWQETCGVAHAAYRAVDDQSPVYDHEWVKLEDAILHSEGSFRLCNQIRQLVNQDPIERGTTQAEALAASAKRAGDIRHAKQRYGNLDKVLEGRYPVKGVRVETAGRRITIPTELHQRLKKGPIFLNIDADRVDFLDSEAGKVITPASSTRARVKSGTFSPRSVVGAMRSARQELPLPAQPPSGQARSARRRCRRCAASRDKVQGTIKSRTQQ